MNWIEVILLENEAFIEPILYSLIILIILYGLKSYIRKLIFKKVNDPTKQFTMQKVIKFLFAITFIIALIIIWEGSSGFILSIIGFLTAGIAIAMRDILLNMIGYFYILWGSPFKVGDRIEIS